MRRGDLVMVDASTKDRKPGLFVEEFYLEPDDDERMGDWLSVVIVAGIERTFATHTLMSMDKFQQQVRASL